MAIVGMVSFSTYTPNILYKVTRPNTRAIILKCSTISIIKFLVHGSNLKRKQNLYRIEVAISFFGRPALGDFSDHKARQPLKFVVA